MNKTDQQKNNKYINYWAKEGLTSKEVNKSMKLKIVTTYTDKSGTERTRTTLRHPKLNEITFTNLPVASKALTKEQKQERFEKSPYSIQHKKLVANVYGKSNNTAKQQARIAAHESKIANILHMKHAQKLAATKKRDAEKSNLLIINRINYNGVPYTFSITPSAKSLDELYKDGKDMAEALSKEMKGFFSIEVWEKEEYMRKIMQENANYRYCIYRTKTAA